MRVLIADDERPARAKVRRFLATDPDVVAVHESWDGPTTLEVMREAAPDLVFLDVQMPGMTGVEVLEAFPRDAMPHVVFVTAFDDYALRAFDLCAVDYLLKPFDEGRFGRALERAKAAMARQARTDDVARLARLVREMAAAGGSLERLLVDEGGRRVLVALADVDRMEADRNYVRLFVRGAVLRWRGTLNELEARVDPARFARVGRGTIVNLTRVAHLEPVGHGDYVVVLRDGGRVRLSRRYVARVENRLGS